MRKLVMMKLVALCALSMTGLAAAAAPSAYRAEASLAAAVTEATNTEIDGVTWRCEGTKCVGTAERYSTLDSYMKACRKVASSLGELTAYSSRGREMSKRDLTTCNRATK